jgi:formamidopyrimidine-DNA glycosylase
LSRLFHSRRLAIKAALLNQTLLSGVGNIYADESLFAPAFGLAAGGRLTRPELERLRLALHEVLLRRHPAGRLIGERLC